MKRTRELYCRLGVPAAVHDQHVRDPDSALLIFPSTLWDESAWMRNLEDREYAGSVVEDLGLLRGVESKSDKLFL
jgi:hypothetical protein